MKFKIIIIELLNIQDNKFQLQLGKHIIRQRRNIKSFDWPRIESKIILIFELRICKCFGNINDKFSSGIRIIIANDDMTHRNTQRQ